MFNQTRELIENASALPKNAGEQINKEIVMSMRQTAKVYSRFVSMPDIRVVSDLGSIIYTEDVASHVNGGQFSINGEKIGDNDRLEFKQRSTNVSILAKLLTFSNRQIKASGEFDLTTTTIKSTIDAFTLQFEKMIFEGNDVKYNGHEVFGLLNHPNVKTVTTSDWSSLAGTEIVKEINNKVIPSMIDAHQGLDYFLIVGSRIWNNLQNDYSSYGGASTRKRILDTPNIKDILHSSMLKDDGALLVNVSPRTMKIITGNGVSAVSIASGNKVFQSNVLVYGLGSILLLPDFDGNLAVVKCSP